MFISTRLPKGLLLVLFVLFSTGQMGHVSAGTNVWTGNGPGGGSILALAIDPFSPAIVYAGTLDGVFSIQQVEFRVYLPFTRK